MVSFDIVHSKNKLTSFPSHYMKHFDSFWKWKLKVETDHKHILDINHLEEAYGKLCYILPRWQTYRSGGNLHPLITLKASLEKISDEYNQIRKYSLLEFNDIPRQLLELIWNELGRVKEYNGNRNDAGCYYIIAICKPLMLLWGQTLAFDSNVRKHTPWYVSKTRTRWTFGEWKKVMEKFQESLQEDSEIVDFFKIKSLEKYGNDSFVPYGRFLDIYYY